MNTFLKSNKNLLLASLVLLQLQVRAQSDQDFVPEWSKSAIWYQIFPERFRDGDPNNNPTIKDLQFADPQEFPKQWEIHPWGSDWYELQPYELANGEPEMWKHILRRRYGGDLQGIIDKLDYLSELGINAIYLNPIFEAPSHHKYDGMTYHHVDPNFGPDPEGDRALMMQENPLDPDTWVWTSADLLALQLIELTHSREIRIIFDGVFNHMGIGSFAFQDVLKNQEKSPYKDWFYIKSFEDKSKNQDFEYQGWFGVKSLPELKEDEHGLAIGPKDYIFNATKRWMNPDGRGPQAGIDGWRLDVAYCIDHDFWKDWRTLVKSINPEAYLTAEIVDTPEKVKPYMQGDEFDGEMNYNFAFACAEFLFNPTPTAISASEFDRKLKEMRTMYPDGVPYASQNLFGSHDANRIGSHIMNAHIENFRNWGSYFGKSQVGNNKKYNARKPDEHAIQLQKLFAVLQMTNVGAPMIYYGDEVGMWGANDPDCRKPMVWDDIKYTPETFNFDQSHHEKDFVNVNSELLDFYKLLIQIRKEHAALSIGEFKTLMTNDLKGLYVYERVLNNDRVIICVNNSSKTDRVIIPNIGANCVMNLLTGEIFELDQEQLQLNLAGKTAMVLVPCK